MSATRLGPAEVERAPHAALPDVNVAHYLAQVARRSPGLGAIRAPARDRLGRRAWHSVDYGALDRRCDALAHGLAERGLEPGQRVAVFVRPGAELVALTFALVAINGWNRLAIAFRAPAGSYQSPHAMARAV